jgi:hypothetical protein
MAGLEVVVRPVVLPNIRPASPRVLPPEDDPTQGLCVIGGSGGNLIDLPHSWSVSVSRQKATHTEVVRQFDKEKVHQVDDDGKINKKNYVILERLKRVKLATGGEGDIKILYAQGPKMGNVTILETDVTRRAQ